MYLFHLRATILNITIFRDIFLIEKMTCISSGDSFKTKSSLEVSGELSCFGITLLRLHCCCYCMALDMISVGQTFACFNFTSFLSGSS